MLYSQIRYTSIIVQTLHSTVQNRDCLKPIPAIPVSAPPEPIHVPIPETIPLTVSVSEPTVPSVSSKTSPAIPIHSVHSTSRGCNGNVQKISNHKLAICQCFLIIRTPLPSHCGTYVPGLTPGRLSQIWIHQTKVKIGSASSCFRVDLLYQTCQLFESSV